MHNNLFIFVGIERSDGRNSFTSIVLHLSYSAFDEPKDSEIQIATPRTIILMLQFSFSQSPIMGCMERVLNVLR